MIRAGIPSVFTNHQPPTCTCICSADHAAGPSGPVKLAKKSTTPKKAEPKAEKATEKKVEEKKKPAAKKATTTVSITVHHFQHITNVV